VNAVQGHEKVKLDIDVQEATVPGDRGQLDQLVRNLIDNAIKYGDSDKPVSVSLDLQSDRWLRFSVVDQGQGIAAEHLPHLTRRFYRTDPGRSRASGGTGLGLAIVKHIAERHKGQLDITSTVGVGTTVEIKLPIQ
jgi:two-component system, OmpR family, phosphate regulon sensor histidine kinase PhoR